MGINIMKKSLSELKQVRQLPQYELKKKLDQLEIAKELSNGKQRTNPSK